MANAKQWLKEFQAEIAMAESSRAQGNEGRARVCARRAVGVLLGEFFRRSNQPDPGHSAYVRIRHLVTNVPVTPEVREIANHFLVKINYDHNLPIEADLIQEAKWLANELLQYRFSGSRGKKVS